MDILAIIGIIATVVGITAGVVQVLDYIQKRREQSQLSAAVISRPAGTNDHSSADLYATYEAGLRCLLDRLGKDHPDYDEALIYQQRLVENITATRQHGETDTRRAERSEIIEQLNQLALSELGTTFNELCRQPTPPAIQELTPRRIPHNLEQHGELIGRQAEKARVHEALRSRSYLVSIDGMGGIGKTLLAMEVVDECLQASREHRPNGNIAAFEGFIWTTAKDRDLTLNALLDTIAQTLEYPGIAQQPIEEKQTRVQKLLREKPYLLVVDNFETVTDDGVRDFLLRLPKPSKALITTREQELGQAWAISIKELTEAEALALIRYDGKRLGLVSLERAEDEVLARLCRATGGAPLAIKWAVGQIGQRGQSLEMVLIALREARAGTLFEDIFARSWGLLSEDAQRVLAVMPLFATSASKAAIQAISDVHDFALDEAMGQLVGMSLIDAADELETEQRRYSIHPLTRAYAAKKDESKPMHRFVQAAFGRRLRYYDQLVAPPEELRVGDPYWDGTSIHSEAQGLQPEWDNLASLIRWTLDHGRDAEALHLFLPVVHLLNAWGLWKERLSLSYEMCAVARRLEDPCEAWLWIDAIGFMASEQGRLAEFEEALEQGRSAARRFNMADALLLADAFEAEEYIYFDKRDLLAFQKIESALEQVDWTLVFEGNRVHQIVLSRAAGAESLWHWREKDFEDAKKWYVLELKLRQSVGENVTRPLILMARVSLELHDIAAAESYLEEASIHPRPRDLASLSYTRALIAEQKGQTQEALRLAELAIEQHDRFGYEKEAARYKELLNRLRSLRS